jgi:hypothetical protein
LKLRRADEEPERLLILDLRDPAVADEQAVEDPGVELLARGLLATRLALPRLVAKLIASSMTSVQPARAAAADRGSSSTSRTSRPIRCCSSPNMSTSMVPA